MKLYFPARVDSFPLSMSTAERNAYENTDQCTIVDLQYAVRDLQAQVLSLIQSGSVVETSTVVTTSGDTVNLATVNAAIASLQSQISAMPGYFVSSGPPAASLGNNGSICWDQTNSIEYRKLGGTWRQVA